MILPNGYVIYRGPSLLNGAPIVAIVIAKSSNPKTGDMSQAYILPDNEDGPVAAIRNGADESVCGDCQHRPLNAGTCYVVVRQGATKVWGALQFDQYPDFTQWPDIIGEVLRDRMLRLGTYGDPAAVPVAVWRDLTACLRGLVGYTHQWRQAAAQPLRDLCMASVDTPAELDLARAMGWRTFRVRTADEPLLHGEAVCPASAEAGHKLTCSTCGACDGAGRGRRGSVSIVIHGNHPEHRQMRFLRSREAAVA